MNLPKKRGGGFTPQESFISIFPAIMAGILVLTAITFASILYFPPRGKYGLPIVTMAGLAGVFYLSAYYFLLVRSFDHGRFAWANAILAAGVLSAFAVLLAGEVKPLLYALIFIGAAATSLTASRGPSYLLALLPALTDIGFHILSSKQPVAGFFINMGFIAAALIAIESVQQIKGIARRHIQRLEVVNEVSKQIISSIEKKQVFTLLNAAFQNALEADAYYLGIREGDELNLELFYDDGEYFNGMKMNLKGTLSSWVIRHQQELFLPDLRDEVHLDDVEMIIIGQEKTSLSWMGVPMRGTHIDGIMAISAYKPNAFDRSDMELLANIAQRAALALDNAYHHARVEEQARLDSLTQVYNHGYFIQNLKEQSEEAAALRQPLSLIMLDIDLFKQYNDKYGHLAGDEILINLCRIMREHVKKTDAIGRWGGEEFAISLPNTSAEQALQVANRIRNSMARLEIQSEAGTISAPTVSQGIATFPHEATETMKLIDVADKRLYIAKQRGRDQVETAPTLHENI